MADIADSRVRANSSASTGLVRVALATMIGTAIEAFDFIAYGTAAALVFNKIIFPNFDPATGAIAAFATFAVGLFARPIGGILFGHFGDRVGRKSMLTLSLIVTGVATFLIELVPSYSSIGLWAAVCLVILRITQGIAFGGEQVGAPLLAMEHAPARLRALFGSLPQGSPPIGLLLSTAAFSLVSRLPEADFLSWGWRLPFLASVILVAIGVYIRQTIGESPTFLAFQKTERTRKLPILTSLTSHPKTVLLLIGGKFPEVTLYYLITVFAVFYATPEHGLTRGDALQAVMIGAAFQIVTIPFFGWLSSILGQKRLYVGAAVLLILMGVPLMSMLQSGSPFTFQCAVVIVLAINYAIFYGVQPSFYAAQFPAELRYSGISLGVQIGGAIGGGIAPIVATSLLATYGSLTPIGYYLMALGVIAAGCSLAMRSRYKSDF